MQTYVTHMRHPWRFLREIGFWNFLSFQLFVGGTILSNLSNVIFWGVFVTFLALGPARVHFLFPPAVYHLAVFNFICGTLLMVLLNLIAAFKRRLFDMILYALTAPAYWLLMSFASYRALYQLLFKPSYWDKTEHGLSSMLEQVPSNVPVSNLKTSQEK